MEWREVLTEIERNFGYHKIYDWKIAIDKVQKLVAQYPDNVELIVRYIYMLHNILVEEEYPESEHDLMASLLEKTFTESYFKFSENSEYLFFVGRIICIAEWYFGLNDDIKSVEDTLSYKMQKKASDIEPQNILYLWCYIRSSGEDVSDLLKQLLIDPTWIDWLKTKGFPGQYIIESIESCCEKYKLL